MLRKRNEGHTGRYQRCEKARWTHWTGIRYVHRYSVYASLLQRKFHRLLTNSMLVNEDPVTVTQ